MKMTKKALVAEAKAAGVAVTGKESKAALVRLITEASAPKSLAEIPDEEVAARCAAAGVTPVSAEALLAYAADAGVPRLTTHMTAFAPFESFGSIWARHVANHRHADLGAVRRAAWAEYRAAWPCFLLELPEELLLYICSHLLPHHLVAMSATCRQMRRIARDNTLWRPLVMDLLKETKTTLSVAACETAELVRSGAVEAYTAMMDLATPCIVHPVNGKGSWNCAVWTSARPHAASYHGLGVAGVRFCPECLDALEDAEEDGGAFVDVEGWACLLGLTIPDMVGTIYRVPIPPGLFVSRGISKWRQQLQARIGELIAFAAENGGVTEVEPLERAVVWSLRPEALEYAETKGTGRYVAGSDEDPGELWIAGDVRRVQTDDVTSFAAAAAPVAEWERVLAHGLDSAWGHDMQGNRVTRVPLRGSGPMRLVVETEGGGGDWMDRVDALRRAKLMEEMEAELTARGADEELAAALLGAPCVGTEALVTKLLAGGRREVYPSPAKVEAAVETLAERWDRRGEVEDAVEERGWDVEEVAGRVGVVAKYILSGPFKAKGKVMDADRVVAAAVTTIDGEDAAAAVVAGVVAANTAMEKKGRRAAHKAVVAELGLRSVIKTRTTYERAWIDQATPISLSEFKAVLAAMMTVARKHPRSANAQREGIVKDIRKLCRDADPNDEAAWMDASVVAGKKAVKRAAAAYADFVNSVCEGCGNSGHRSDPDCGYSHDTECRFCGGPHYSSSCRVRI